MSYLIVQDIVIAGIEQDIRLQLNANLYAIKLNLMKYGTPTGNLIIEIKEGSNVVKTITTAMSVLNAEIADAYGYGMFKFDLDIPIKKTGEYTEYTIKLSSSVDDVNNYYAWCKDWEKDYDDLWGSLQTNGVADDEKLKPFHIRFLEYK